MKRSRRAVLQAAALLGSLGVAGCHQGGNSTNGNNPGNGNGGTPSKTGSGTPTGSATGTSSPTGSAEPTPDPVGSSERWNKLQYDNLNTGLVDLNHGTFENSTVNWSVDMNGSPGLQPAFDEQRVYVPTQKALYAIDRASGDVVWRYDATEGPVTTPLLQDGFVYSVTGAGVIKLNAEAGWSALDYRFNSTVDNLLSVVAPSAPVQFGDKMIFNVIVQTGGERGKQKTRLVALDFDGNQQWIREEPVNEVKRKPPVRRPPANRKNKHDDFLAGREATTPASGFAPTPAITGSAPWSQPTPTPTPSPTPTPETPTPTSSPTPTPETPTPTPTSSPTPTPTPTPRPQSMRSSTLYITHGWGKQDATLYALDPNTGRRKRIYYDPLEKVNRGFRDYTGKGWSSISVKRGLLFFADKYADVFVAGNLKKVVRRTLDPPPNAYACAVGPEHAFMSSRVYEGNEGKLFAVDDAGRIDWTFAGEGNLSPPTLTNDTAYIASASGALFALDRSDGLVRWRQDLGVSGPVNASGPVISTDEVFTVVGGSGSSKVVSVSPVK